MPKRCLLPGGIGTTDTPFLGKGRCSHRIDYSYASSSRILCLHSSGCSKTAIYLITLSFRIALALLV